MIVIERTITGYSAHDPDHPGVVATGNTKAEADMNFEEALKFHLEAE